MRGAITGIVVFVDHRVWRSAANRGRPGVDEAFQTPPAHRLGDRERSAHVGGADAPAVAEGRAGGQVEDVFDAVQMWRVMPVVGKKIAAQYLNVLGERVGRREAGC